MTLNAVIALILCFFSTNSTDFQADYITVVEDRPIRKILSPSSSLLLLVKTITHPAARSFCDSWASCLVWYWLEFLPIELIIPLSMRCVVLCVRTLPWFDYCDCMMFVCLLFILSLSVTLPFWRINVFILLITVLSDVLH